MFPKLTLFAVLTLAAFADAQGSDACLAAQPIAGYGLFPFDTTGATTDGLPVPGCKKAGNNQIDNDVWFVWTAGATEQAQVSTCGLATFDTMIAIHDGVSCSPSAVIACDDDSGCAFQTSVTFDAEAGNQYLIRIGNFPGANTGSGSFSIDPPLDVVDCDPPIAGADVIVGDLVGYLKYGTIGSKTGYAFGTDACNIGTAEMPWEGPSNLHPVISSNLYRLKNGRFEQIGMSWVKHGFASLTDNSCCICQDPGNGQIMGIGCSDLYVAVINGDQVWNGVTGGIGPRSDVNPSTGSFPWPYTTQGMSGDEIYKRMQVDLDDLNPLWNAGASYFIEAQYINPTDAAAGNGLNNVTYETLEIGAFDGTGYQLNMNSLPYRTEPAILGWAVADPGVQIEIVDVPGDGRLYVASRATDIGNGAWRYEYALYNMNSNRAIRKLVVPTASGAVLADVDFHDIDQHSGEIWDSTDWSSVVSAGSVSWFTDSPLVNPLANALRWGTIYNFGFKSNAAPGDVSVTIHPFLDGSPNSIAVPAVGPINDPGGVAVCFGDGSDTHCPCDNESLTPGRGCQHSGGVGMYVTATGSSSITADDLELTAHDCLVGNTGIFYAGQSSFMPARHLFDGLQCANGNVLRFRGQIAASSTVSDFGFVAQDEFGVFWSPGTTYTFQYFSRDNQGGPSPCGLFANLSAGYQIVMTP